MATGAAESWYHEKQSAWLYGVVASAEPDPVKRALFGKLASAAENQATCWLATRPKHEQQHLYTPALRARIVARLVQKLGPRRLRDASAGGNLRAAVFGASDGLVSNAALVMGVAAASPDLRMLLIGGGAGIAAWGVGKLLGASIA